MSDNWKSESPARAFWALVYRCPVCDGLEFLDPTQTMNTCMNTEYDIMLPEAGEVYREDHPDKVPKEMLDA